AAHVNNVRIGRSNGQRADRAGRLIVKNRIPGVSEIRGLPDAAIDGRHIEDVRLVRHARDGYRAASAERADAAPAHLGVELLIKSLADFLVEFLRIRRRRKRKKQKGTKNTCADDSPAEPLPCRTDSHPSPP